MIYVGYDENYQFQFDMCCKSIGWPVEKTPNHLVTREQDGSTQFTYSRFLIPFISKYRGWHLFCDSDFIFLDDPTELFGLIDPSKAVMVVKHKPYDPLDIKMNGKRNTMYPRKNWSSLILWNADHESNFKLIPRFVNIVDPSYLHQFKWLDDSEIGELPHQWNVLVDHHDTQNASALHFTNGTNNKRYNKYIHKLRLDTKLL